MFWDSMLHEIGAKVSTFNRIAESKVLNETPGEQSQHQRKPFFNRWEGRDHRFLV